MPTASNPKPKAKLSVVAGGSASAGAGPSDFEGKYQILFDQASDAIMTIRPDGRIDDVNQAVEEMTGYMKTELAGADVSLLAPGADRVSAPQHGKPLSAQLFETPGTYEDVAIVRNDGYIRFVDLSVRLVESGEAMLTMALFRDVTEKKRMERELIAKHSELRNAYFQLEKKNAELQALQDTLVQSGKMAALGELSAGIAHELNQPLQGIRGYAQELQAMTEAESRGAGQGAVAAAGQPAEYALFLREIVSNVDKMAGIIEYMRAFIRKSNEGHEMVDVHDPIEESLKMLARQFAMRGIQVERRFDRSIPQVYANPLQLEQVFINLSTNARDAIEATGRGGGKVEISTRQAGDFVEIVFKDDGTGMADRTKAKAFNPFFTTKETGKGMGLGLSLSYGILNKLHGSIVVESELGKGAEFLIRIPKDFRELG